MWITILILFLLPVFPISMLVNKLLSVLNYKLFTVLILTFFICGNLTLLKFNINSQIFQFLQFLAVFTILFYSFRLLGVKNLKTFILYLYPIISSLALLWYMIGGDILEFLALKTPILISFLALYTFLFNQFGIIHQKSISGLGSMMPRFSIFFVLSIMGISSSMFFLGYEMLEIEISKLPIVYGVSLVVSWIFINWSSIRVVEWLIYGTPNKLMECRDLDNKKMIFFIFLILISVVFFIFYSLRGLA